MILTLIAAASENNVIGDGNKMPWRLPDDFARLQRLTKGHPIIMGRKTHESIGRVLPDRLNIVVTRNTNYRAVPGAQVVHSLDEALDVARATGTDEAFIFGGGELYAQSIEKADRVQLTKVHTNIPGDAFFVELRADEWELVFNDYHDADERHPFAFAFLTYERKR